MTDIYNLTNYTNATNLFEMAVASNQLSGGLMFIIVLVVVLLISFVALRPKYDAGAYLASAFITFVLSVMLWSVGLVVDKVVIAFFVWLMLLVAVQVIK